MADTEIERLIVRLVGDNQNYIQSLKKSQDETTVAMKSIDKSVTDTQSKLSKLGQAIGSAGIAAAFVSLGQEAVSGFAEAESAEFRLRAALEANGKAVDATFKDYAAFAAQLQSLTTIEDDAVIGMFQMAESYGVSGEAAKRAIKNAQALASAKGGEASSYLRLTTALEQGSSAMLVRQLPALRSIKNEAERTAKAHEMLGKMFKVAEAEVNTYAGQMKQLKVAYGNMLEDFGGILVGWLKPVVAGVKQVVGWFQGLSTEVKRIIIVATLLTAALSLGTFISALSSVIPLATAFTGILSTIGAIAATVFSPIGILIGAIAIGVYALTQRLGGLAAVWELIKQGATAMWEALQPIFIQLWDLGVTVFTGIWTTVSTVFTQIFDFISSIWASVGTTTTSFFVSLRDGFLNTLIFAEYAFQNIGTIAAMLWVNLEHGAVKFFNQLVHFFTVVIPKTVTWFGENWRDIFFTSADYILTIMINLGKNIRAIFDAAWEYIKSGGTSGFEIDWTPLTDGFVNTIKELPDIPERVVGDLEQQLAEEAAALNEQVGSEFEDFRQQKMDQFAEAALPTGIKDQVEKAGALALPAAENVSKQIGKALGKWESVEFGGAEALARLAESFQTITEGSATGAAGAGAGGKGGKPGLAGGIPAHETKMEAVDDGTDMGGSDDLASMSKGIDKLVEIGEQQLREPKIELETAGIA